ncbi:MAG TPA: hypothetical protein VKS60_20365 [Stellaceae bacterium]|nr:hypothetical protein [Stellaceae bacterium]
MRYSVAVAISGTLAMPGVCAARAKRLGGTSVAMALQRRAAARPFVGATGNQAILRRFPLLQRQPTTDEQPKPPDPKPMIPLGNDWKLDPSASHMDPPKPWDQPGAGSGGPSGVSLEDINKGRSILFGRKGGPPPLNMNFRMPSCSALETADSTPTAPKYKSFQTYDTERKVFHSALSKDPWPQLTPEQYQAAIDDCKAKAPKPMQPLPVPPKPQPNDAPGGTLPPGMAYA